MKTLSVIITTIFILPLCFAQATFDCNPATQQKFLDVNNVRALISNKNLLWMDNSDYQPYYQVPKHDTTNTTVSAKNVFFCGGLWMGGLADNGQLKVAAGTYSTQGYDFWPGPIENEMTNLQTCNAWDQIFEITSAEINDFLNNGIISENLVKYPAKNNPHILNEVGISLQSNQNYFPFYDVNDDGNYNPNDGDYPNITGDQSLFWIMNDVGNFHDITGGQALGVEIKCNAFAYDVTNLDTTTFYRFKVTNKSNEKLNDYVFGLFIDPDLGFFGDDFVGVDTANSFGYFYNGDAFDEASGNNSPGYGTDIPIVGIVLLDVPYEVKENESKLGAFVYYNNDFTQSGNPENAPDYNSYLHAKWKNDEPITYGENGTNLNNPPTKFMYSSAPNDTSTNAWSECSVGNNPADRRFLMAAKPIDLEVGETVKYELAVVTTFNVSYPCPDILGLQESVEYVQAYYDNFIKAQLLTTDLEKENVTTNEVKIFPNPVNDFIKIKSEEQFVKATLYSLSGKIVSNEMEVSENFIDLSDNIFLTGNYFLKLFNADSEIVVKNILILQ